jgi:V8-like Glu-specific endopeptidase
MPATTPTGLHTPVTNMPPTEATITQESVSKGDAGFGDEVQLAPGAVDEPISRSRGTLESAPQFTAPETEGLRDVGEASFGPVARLEAVIGTDERVRIQDTSQLPWRLSASLLITAADNSQWIGTAWFISPRTLATAGHCVYIKHSGVPGRDGFVKKIQVMPGRNASQVPFGGLTATEFWTVKGWEEDGLETFDYGAIILPSAFPQNLGHFGFGVFTDATLVGVVANVAGYPGDKPSGTLWFDKRQVGSVKPEKVFYAADTAGGQSGACVYMIRNSERLGIAIHAYGGATANSGTRISEEVFANLNAWKRS